MKPFFLVFSSHFDYNTGLEHGRLGLYNARGIANIWVATTSTANRQQKESFHQRGGMIPPPYRVPAIKQYEVETKPIDLSRVTGVSGNFYKITPFEVKTDRGGVRSDFGIHKDANIPGCHSVEGLQVLTAEGFKSPYEITLEDKVAQYDLKTEEFFFDNPYQIVLEPYKGTMVKLAVHGNYDAIVTPNHTFLIDNYYGCKGCSRKKIKLSYSLVGLIKERSNIFPGVIVNGGKPILNNVKAHCNRIPIYNFEGDIFGLRTKSSNYVVKQGKRAFITGNSMGCIVMDEWRFKSFEHDMKVISKYCDKIPLHIQYS